MPPQIVWSAHYEVDIGAHVFPTRKYRLVHDALVESGVAAEEDFVDPPAPLSDREIGLAHSAEYLSTIAEDSFTPLERRTLEVPFTPELDVTMRLCCAGTLLAGRIALDGQGACAHLGGGFHHAYADHGEGFCLLNDVAVATLALLDEGAIERAAIIDLDVHHGNGTAAILADEPNAFTLSMHQQNNYPADKPPSDLDVGLPDGIGDQHYLELLREHLPAALDAPAPELVYYLAGADPYRLDQLGGLALTRPGLRERDRAVLEACRSRGIPVAVVLAGGYALDTRDTVAIHVATVEETLGAAS